MWFVGAYVRKRDSYLCEPRIPLHAAFAGYAGYVASILLLCNGLPGATSASTNPSSQIIHRQIKSQQYKYTS
jgi:hypothetical protein